MVGLIGIRNQGQEFVPICQFVCKVDFIQIPYYVWFPENLKENIKERKYKGKVEGNKK